VDDHNCTILAAITTGTIETVENEISSRRMASVPALEDIELLILDRR
jgi:hypothetical protein